MPLTLKDIAALIKSNKIEILTKVKGVVQDVNDMKSEVKVLSERADSEQQKNEERFLMLERQICDLKKSCPPSFAQVVSTPSSQPALKQKEIKVQKKMKTQRSNSLGS